MVWQLWTGGGSSKSSDSSLRSYASGDGVRYTYDFKSLTTGLIRSFFITNNLSEQAEKCGAGWLPPRFHKKKRRSKSCRTGYLRAVQ